MAPAKKRVAPQAKRRGRPPAIAKREARQSAASFLVLDEGKAAKYADYAPTALQKALARWIVRVCGYSPSQASSTGEAFLQGVALGTTLRLPFTNSAYAKAWREENGVSKPGPKPKPKATPRKKVAYESVIDDDDYEFDDNDVSDDYETDVDDSDSDDEFDDSNDIDDTEAYAVDDDDDDDDDNEFNEPEPPRRKVAPAKKAASKKAIKPGNKRRATAPAPTRVIGRPVADEDDDDILF